MNNSESHPGDIIEQAEAIVKEATQKVYPVPLRILYDMGAVLASKAVGEYKEGNEENLERTILSKIEKAVPRELIKHGWEGYSGDGEEEFPASFDDEEMGIMGEAVLALPKTRELTRGFNLDPEELSKIIASRNGIFSSFFALLQLHTQNGGAYRPDLILRGMEELNQ